jgi:anti-sigma-K factor RskA
MSTNDSTIGSHPEELLDAYALDALDDEETALVESHLETCPRCQETLAGLQRAAALLGQSVEQRQPPPATLPRIMDSLPPAELVLAGRSDRPSSTGPNIRLAVWALPLAAAVVIALFSISLIMNLRGSSRMDQLEQENSTMSTRLDQSMTETRRVEQENSVLTARLNQLITEESQLADSVRQTQVTNYLAAHPDTEELILEPPSGVGDSQGVLLVADGGHNAVLMVSHMEQPPPLRAYQVWLVREGGHRVAVGQIQVDPSGWGTLTLHPPEPLFRFHWVNLTIEEMEEERAGPDKPVEKTVLRSRISPSGGTR